MKKIYALTVVCLALAFTGTAQTYYWIGASGGNWSTASNWSLSSHGAAAAAAPSLSSDNVVLDTSISINLDGSKSISTFSVINNKSVKITGTGGGTLTLTLNSTSATTPGLRIDAGSKLENDAAANTEFIVDFPAGAQGKIDGEWLFSGNIDDLVNALAYFTLSGPSFSSTRVNVNGGGKMTVGSTGFMFANDPVGETELVFNAGSTLEFKGDNVAVPAGNYNAASTILVDGMVNGGGMVFSESNAIGNLIFNCPALAGPADLNLYDININGNFLIQNTNGQVVSLIGTKDLPNPSVNVGVNGNLIISGNSSVVESSSFDDKTTNLTVQGDFTSTGTSFDLQSDNTANLPTNLIVKKNFSVGAFGASSTATNETTNNLFNVEFNGSTAQTLTSTTGSIDNSTHQVTLRMNNALGVNLSSNLAVGRVDFATTNKGIIHTGANTFTINNTSGNARVVNGYGSNAFVEGTVARVVKAATAAIFPTGVSGSFRKLTLTPNNTATNTFTVSLVAGNNGGTPVSPVAGLSNYYWNVTRTGTSSATIAMDLAGAEPLRSATDTLIAAAYSGGNWLDARATGNYIFPGNSASGTVTTSLQSSFSAFTIGYIINAALPIKLLSFTGKKLQNTAELSWLITENSTAVKFDVVKSSDGVSFAFAGSLPGETGKLNYSFTDNTLAAGNNFYRLKMYDKDGSITYSNIIVVMNGSKGVMISSMIPTVVKDRARLNISSSVKGSMQLVVTDISGRIMQHQTVSVDTGSQEIWLNASSLSAGMFQITGYINGEKTATFRFIKQ